MLLGHILANLKNLTYSKIMLVELGKEGVGLVGWTKMNMVPWGYGSHIYRKLRLSLLLILKELKFLFPVFICFLEVARGLILAVG